MNTAGLSRAERLHLTHVAERMVNGPPHAHAFRPRPTVADRPRRTHTGVAWAVTLGVMALMLLVVAPCGSAARARGGASPWIWQHPLPQGNDLTAVTFSSATEGWTVGAAGTVLRTADAGSSWQPQSVLTRTDLTDVSFCDEDHGMAVGDAGTVLRTDDGGETWQVSVTAAGEDHVAVVVASPSRAWILTTRVDPGVPDPGPKVTTSAVLRTDDGGDTWSELKTWPGVRLRDLSFATADNGWAVGAAAVYRTSDGGVSWQPVDTGTPGADFEAVQARTADDIWMVADDEIVHSGDGGSTWSRKSFWWYSSEPYASVAFTDALHGAIAGAFAPDETARESGVILTTDDGGVTWVGHYEMDYLEGTFTSVAFADADTLCCVGDSGTVVRSTDGGATWSGRKPCAWRALNAVDGVGDFVLAAGGDYGSEETQALVARSRDGGAGWTVRLIKEVYEGLNGVDVVSETTAYAVGDRGTVARTSTAGVRWRVRYGAGGTSADLMAVAFARRGGGWAVGSRGVILHTGDGRRWTKQTSATRRTLFDIAALSRRCAVAVGDDGVALRTTDGGARWRRVRTRTAATLAAVDFVDRTRGWAVGARWGEPITSVLRHTVDGGLHWHAHASPTAPDEMIVAVDFVTRRSGWIASDNGRTYTTHDAGLTWAAEATGAARDVRGLIARPSGEAWIVGGNAAILHRAAGP